jgi:hypothetical protein
LNPSVSGKLRVSRPERETRRRSQEAVFRSEYSGITIPMKEGSGQYGWMMTHASPVYERAG